MEREKREISLIFHNVKESERRTALQGEKRILRRPYILENNYRMLA